MTFTFEDVSKPTPRRRSSTDSHKARTLKTVNNDLQFIAVDGEGIRVPSTVYVEEYIDGTWTDVARTVEDHNYVLLSVGNESLYFEDQRRLTHREIFPFLLDQFAAHPDAVFVGYFLGYDFTHWVREFDARSAWLLLTPQGKQFRRYWSKKQNCYKHSPVIIDEQWEIESLWPKQFRLKRHYHSEFGHKVSVDGRPIIVPCLQSEPMPTEIVKGKEVPARQANAWMYVNDVGSFFQTPFLNAIDPGGWTGVKLLSVEDYETLKNGKENLRKTATGITPELIEYNLTENRILQELMKTLNAGFVSDNIRLGRSNYYGPGQAANEWLGNIGAPLGKEVRQSIPLAAREAARASFYGGWFEIFAHGIIEGKSYGYDINSAYPDVIRSLPCLLHGKWKHGKGKPRRSAKSGVLRLCRVLFKGENPYAGGMPLRTKDGRVFRPRMGRGWYWQDELDASVLAGLINELKYYEYWDYEPCKCPPPLKEIEILYQGRLAIEDGESIKNTPKGKAKKLVYNSTYGKCCQSVGTPKWANVIYASRITSGCRKKILEAIATHPQGAKHLLMVATDGVYFASPHNGLTLSETELGLWDPKIHENLALFLPGMYWDEKDRKAIREGKEPKLKSRGVASKDLKAYVNVIEDQWKRGIIYPNATINLNFCMTGAKLAIARRAWETCGADLQGQFKVIDSISNSSKRMLPEVDEILVEYGIDRNHPEVKFRGATRSFPYLQCEDGLDTYPYQKTFGDDECEHDDSHEVLSEEAYLKILEEDESELYTTDGTLRDILPTFAKDELMD